MLPILFSNVHVYSLVLFGLNYSEQLGLRPLPTVPKGLLLTGAFTPA